MTFQYLSHDDIAAVHAAATQLRLSPTALLAGLNPEYVSSLCDDPNSAGQLRLLHELNRVERLRDGSVPLRVWLDNARLLANLHVQAEVFGTALDVIARRAAPPVPVPTPPGPRVQIAGRSPSVARRREEVEALRLLDEGHPVAVMGPERFGKTTFLRQLVDRTREDAAHPASVVELDLRNLGMRAQASLDDWMISFIAYLLHQLGVDPAKAADLRAIPLPWPVKVSRLVEREVFAQTSHQILLVLDNADAAWGLPFQDEVYYLLRAWCEDAAKGPPWDRMRMVLALSTTPALLHDGPSVSPWNLAPPVELQEFSRDQVAELGRLLGKECTEVEVGLLLERVGGHPWLLRLIVQRWKFSGQMLETILEEEEQGVGQLAEHLVRLGEMLRKEPDLAGAVCRVLDNPQGAQFIPTVFERLRRAGIMQLTQKTGYKIRFPLHEAYLRRRWRPFVMVK